MADLAAIAAARDEWLQVLAQDDDSVRAIAESRLLACRKALEIVDTRLQAIEYPVHPIVEALSWERLDDMHRRLAEVHIAIPPLLALVWRVVGKVSVLDFNRYRHVAFWTRRLGDADEYTDGLHIDSPGDVGDDYLSYVEYLVEERECWLDSDLAAGGEPFELSIAPDDFHKDNVSGGEPYGLRAGVGMWDHRVANFAWRGRPVSAPKDDPDLLSYLRTAVLECGCFPGFYGLAAFESDRQYLTADLPIF